MNMRVPHNQVNLDVFLRNPANDGVQSDTSSKPLPRNITDAFQHWAMKTIKTLWNRNAYLEKENEELRRLAYHDALTGLFNRAALNKELNKIHQDNTAKDDRRQHKGSTLLMIDLDGFKAINDTFGHDVGDEVLCKVADTLKSIVRKTDMVARIGGDEFVVVCKGAGVADVQPVVDHIKWVLDTLSIKHKDVEIQIRGSVGSCRIDPQRQPADMLKDADAAMYEVKRGKGDTRLRLHAAPVAAVA